MWVVLAVGVVALGFGAAALRSAGRARARLLARATASLSTSLVTTGFGLGATIWTVSRVFRTVAEIEPSMKANSLATGISGAMNNALLGVALAVFPLVAGLIALARALALPRAGDETKPPEAL